MAASENGRREGVADFAIFIPQVGTGCLASCVTAGALRGVAISQGGGSAKERSTVSASKSSLGPGSPVIVLWHLPHSA